MLLGKRKLVRVQQHAGPTIEGVLVHRGKDCYRVVDAVALVDEDTSHALDGVIEIPRERVYFLQLLANGA